MQDKLKNWEELCNDGENYGNESENLSPKEKILFENIKDKKVLKIQDAYLFSKSGKIEENHGRDLAEMIAHFPFVKKDLNYLRLKKIKIKYGVVKEFFKYKLKNVC